MFYSRRPPTLDKFGPWANIWEEDQDLREILESLQEQSQVNPKSALKSNIIQNNIQCLNNQLIEDTTQFEKNSLTLSSVKVRSRVPEQERTQIL